jgi:hypothetical protein
VLDFTLRQMLGNPFFMAARRIYRVPVVCISVPATSRAKHIQSDIFCSHQLRGFTIRYWVEILHGPQQFQTRVNAESGPLGDQMKASAFILLRSLKHRVGSRFQQIYQQKWRIPDESSG